MLVNVHVKNLALIDEAEVYFDEGLNILTGETGAGKSIIIGSINLALGSRVPKDIVREGADYGLVELVFDTESDRVKVKLKELDIPEEDGQIVISRRINNGRSIIKVNGETCSAALLRELADELIDIYGQHDNQYLIKKTKHLGLLDEYGSQVISPLLDNTKKIYEEYRDIKEKIAELDIDEEEKNKEMSFLEFQINEIEDAAVAADEDEILEEEFKKINHSKKIMESLSAVYSVIGDGDNSFGENLGYGIRELSQVIQYDDKIKEFYSTLMDVDAICSDVSRQISDYMEELSFDEERVSYVTERLDIINRLKMKYGGNNGNGGVSEIEKTLNKLKERYELLQNTDRELGELKGKLLNAEDELKKSCENLSRARKKTAVEFEKKITEELVDLNFMEVNFKVNFEKSESYSAKGNDTAEFYISTNAGEKLKPLSQVASGGELSRIMLAFKTILAGQDDTETLIFDEIDTGISGRTAQKVSEKMRRISRNRQVMAITHLPQIAAMADSHFLIEKSARGGKTVTEIKKMTEEESVMELARMLGGREVTDTVIENAREMKKMADDL